MCLIQSANLIGSEPLTYLKDVLTCLPTLPASRVGELLAHRWQPRTLIDLRSLGGLRFTGQE